MAYNDFIDYINEYFNRHYTYSNLENLINYGVSWCTDGKDENTGKSTTLCANCKYFNDCDHIIDLFDTDIDIFAADSE